MEGGGVEKQPYLSGSARKDDAVSLVLVVPVFSQMIHKDDEKIRCEKTPYVWAKKLLKP